MLFLFGQFRKFCCRLYIWQAGSKISMVSPVLGYSAVWRQDLMRKSSSISEFFFVYLFSSRHHPLPPESDVPGGVVDDPHQLLLLDALQPVRVTFNALRLLFLLLFVFNVVTNRTLPSIQRNILKSKLQLTLDEHVSDHCRVIRK